MPKTIRLAIDSDLWKKAKKASAESDFGAGILLNWVLESESEDFDEWAKELQALIMETAPKGEKLTHITSKFRKLLDRETDESESEDEDEDETEEESEGETEDEDK